MQNKNASNQRHDVSEMPYPARCLNHLNYSPAQHIIGFINTEIVIIGGATTNLIILLYVLIHKIQYSSSSATKSVKAADS